MWATRNGCGTVDRLFNPFMDCRSIVGGVPISTPVDQLCRLISDALNLRMPRAGIIYFLACEFANPDS